MTRIGKRRSGRMMPSFDSSLKTLALFALLAFGPTICAQDGEQWYGGQSTGFWGLMDSVGVRGVLPGMFNPPRTSPETLNAQRQYGGYRITHPLPIEGAQTHFNPKPSAPNGDASTREAHRPR